MSVSAVENISFQTEADWHLSTPLNNSWLTAYRLEASRPAIKAVGI